MGLGPEWVSASDLRNYCLDETLLDWLNLYGRENGFVPDDELPSYDAETDFRCFIFAKGHEFEAAVMRCLADRGFEWIDLSRPYEERHAEERYEQTIEALRSGAPIVYQGALRHEPSKTYGFPDLLVRSDNLGKLVDEPPLTNDEATIPAPALGLPYHYRVVDIKFSTIELNSRGCVGNSSKDMSRKAQLFVYSRALAAIQGYTPPDAYLLGRKWKQTVKNENLRGKHCLERLCPCDLSDQALESTVDAAAAWVRRVRTEGAAWQVLPEPSVMQLRPGKPGIEDAPWSSAKKRIANELQDPILLPQVRVHGRNNAVSAGIKRFSDEGCTASGLGVTGATHAPLLDRVIRMYWTEEPRIDPPRIVTDRLAWDGGRPLDFYVDFETVSDIDDDFSKMPATGGQPLIFMIGCGHIENGEWRFECFVANLLEEPEEARIIEAWIAHMDAVTKRLAHGAEAPKVFHWSHAENTFLTTAYNSARKRHPDKEWPQPNWYDFLTRVMKTEPVIVKDAMMFGLKPTARAMHAHGFITEQWLDGLGDGMGAMVGAWRCHAKAKAQGILMRDLPMMDAIAKYNETDCRTMQQIIAYLRANH